MPTPGSKPHERILLADAADEADQGRVRAARDLQREVRRLRLQRGDIDRALILERLAREDRNRDRHVLQILPAAACGHDDVGAADGGGRVGIGRGGDFLVGLRRGLRGERRGDGDRGERGAEFEGGE